MTSDDKLLNSSTAQIWDSRENEKKCPHLLRSDHMELRPKVLSKWILMRIATGSWETVHVGGGVGVEGKRCY